MSPRGCSHVHQSEHSGTIKWSQRREWRDNFETALERHVGPACRSAGIGLDELAEIIGDHWMSTLWGCVFEDLVSAGRAERNVADDYLKRRGWKESAGTRAASGSERTMLWSVSQPTRPDTKSGGAGMGLSICRSIIDAYGGRLWADANEPRGAVFQFTLPGKELMRKVHPIDPTPPKSVSGVATG
jgi:hypothetical protein